MKQDGKPQTKLVACILRLECEVTKLNLKKVGRGRLLA